MADFFWFSDEQWRGSRRPSGPDIWVTVSRPAAAGANRRDAMKSIPFPVCPD